MIKFTILVTAVLLAAFAWAKCWPAAALEALAFLGALLVALIEREPKKWRENRPDKR